MLSDEHLLTDVVRLTVCCVALWLAVMVVKVGRMRVKSEVEGSPHMATYLSYAGLLALVCAMRIPRMGEEPTWDLWASAVCVGLGVFGVIRRVKFVPPHKREGSA